MKSSTSPEIIKKIIELKSSGMGSRRIAKELLGSESKKSTVNDIYNRHKNKHKVDKKEPKILVLDIETAPMVAYIYSLWNSITPLAMLNNDWFILSYAAKWFGEDKVYYNDLRGKVHTEDDSELLDDLWTLMDQADFILTQNGKKFDDKRIKARFVMNGYQPPSSYRHIDTLVIAKQEFGFTSNKLEFMTEKLCTKYKKMKHDEFPGVELWKECLRDNPRAWEVNEQYNKYDILSLEELYTVIRPWDRKAPNFNVYTDSTERKCSCGSTSFAKRGFVYSNLGKYQRYKCCDCGAEQRGRTNLLSDTKRKTLMSNVIA